MEQEKPLDGWSGIAQEWIRIIGENGSCQRDGLLDAWMLDAVGDVSGLKVVDLGCGEGRFSRMLARRHADVTGLDLTARFVEYANAHRAGGETYIHGDMQNLAGIEGESFDLAVSYLSLLDVPDFERAVREAHRVLRPGGRFIVCNLHPMVLAGGCWVKAGTEKLHYRLDNYFDESERVLTMCGGTVANYHRTLGVYINCFMEAGFRLDGIREPKPSPEQVAKYPEIADNLRVPEFIIYLLEKENVK
jgi:SAM-dependent methyltransferase